MIRDLRSLIQKCMETPNPVLCVGGSTASGKSALALELAQHYQGVIINADSRQVYQGLPLLTAQPSEQECKEIPHELYQYIPNEAPGIDVMRWIQDVTERIAAAHASGRLPIVTGGTGFYLYALEHGLSPIPEVPRMTLQDVERVCPGKSLHEILTSIDPMASSDIDPSNKQRLLRALSVYYKTRKPLSYWQNLERVKPLPQCTWFKVYLNKETPLLRERIQMRFDLLCKQGLLEEVASFSCSSTAPLTRSIGLTTLQLWIQGQCSWEHARRQFLTETWQYAKRQKTWFKRYFNSDFHIH